MHLRLDAEVRLKATHALLRKHVHATTRWYKPHCGTTQLLQQQELQQRAATTRAATKSCNNKSCNKELQQQELQQRATTTIAATKK